MLHKFHFGDTVEHDLNFGHLESSIFMSPCAYCGTLNVHGKRINILNQVENLVFYIGSSVNFFRGE